MDAGIMAYTWIRETLWKEGSSPRPGRRQALGPSWATVCMVNPESQISLLNFTVCLNDLVLYKNIPVACRRRKNFPEATAARKGYVFRILVCDWLGPLAKHPIIWNLKFIWSETLYSLPLAVFHSSQYLFYHIQIEGYSLQWKRSAN